MHAIANGLTVVTCLRSVWAVLTDPFLVMDSSLHPHSLFGSGSILPLTIINAVSGLSEAICVPYVLRHGHFRLTCII